MDGATLLDSQGLRIRVQGDPSFNPILFQSSASAPSAGRKCMARHAQVVTEFYLVGLLAAAATLLSGCLVLPTMARNTLRSTVSQILTVRIRARASEFLNLT